MPLTGRAETGPLVTFALLAYNQERYIREALEGAFSQTYSPLEIVLSDDCSPDGTFDVIAEMAAAYDGPHEILVNRNPLNLGLAGHVNVVSRLSRGAFIILAAGDDVSDPARAAVLVRHWMKPDPPSAIASRVFDFSDDPEDSGAPRLNFRVPQNRRLRYSDARFQDHTLSNYYEFQGASLAYSAEVFSRFDPIQSGLMAEDQVLAFRASLLSGVDFIDDVLVRYRRHAGNLFNSRPDDRRNPDLVEREKKRAYLMGQKALRYRNHLQDLERASSWLGEDRRLKDLAAVLVRRSAVLSALSEWWAMTIPARILKLLFVVLPHGNEAEKRWAIKRLLPFRVFRFAVRKPPPGRTPPEPPS